MTYISIEEPFQPVLRGLGLDSFDAAIGHFTRQAALCGEVFVTRATLQHGGGALDVFFKLYRHPRPSWRFCWRASKARREFENYRVLARLGAPVAARVAVAEKRDALGRLCGAWIITVAVPQAQTLVEFAGQPSNSAHRQALLYEVAGIARALHVARFQHHDFVWRNILVSSAGPTPRIFLIDCPRGGIRRWGWKRAQLRDLASLDKSAARFCRRTERLRFLLKYLGKDRLDDEARALSRACMDYRRTRWPEDWTGK